MAANIWDFLGLGATGLAGGFLTKEAIDRLSDIGEQAVLGTYVDGQYIPGAVDLAQQAVGMSQFRPFTVASTMPGGGFSAMPKFDEEGNFLGVGTSMTLSDPEKAFQQSMLTRAQQQLAGTPFGQTQGRTAAKQAFGLGSGMMRDLRDTDLAQREQDIYGRIRAAQSPEEQRQAQAMEERLAAQGRLGVQTAQFGGTPEQLAFGKAQAEARNAAMLQAMGQAQAEQAQLAQQAQMFTGMGSQLSQADLQQLAAQQNLGIGSMGAAYLPQTQMMQLQQGMLPYQQMQQQGQLFGAGQFGETMMSGLEARLVAEQAKANLIGGLGSSMLSGLFTPIAQQGGGAASILSSLFSGLSDKRLKKNIRKVKTLNKINLYTWDWNEKGQNIAKDQKTFGVIAQEIQKTRPSAVFTGSDGYLRVDYSKLPEVAAEIFKNSGV